MHIAVPNKGRLHEPTMELLDRAGLYLRGEANRRLYADTVDPEVSVLFARAADIPTYVHDGAAEMGITGHDQLVEADYDDLREVLDLGFGQCRIVLAAPEASAITAPEDIAGRTIATEFPTITNKYLTNRGIDATVVEVTGATELTPHADMADAIVDITSSGTTLAVNQLTVIDELLDSSVRLFVWEDVAADEKIRQIQTALESVIAAEDKRYLMMNVPREHLSTVKDVIPGLGGPTVMDIADGETGVVAVHAVVDERAVFEVITDLKAAGASDILVTEIERLVE